MNSALVWFGIAAGLVGCKSKGSGDGGGEGEGTVVGTLAMRELESSNKQLSIKGQLPESWVQDPSAIGIKLVHRAKDDMNLGHVEVSIDYTTKTPEARAKDTADSEKIHGPGSLVVPPTEIAPGRWGNVFQSMGVQWRPGINMYEAAAYWSAGENHGVRCRVRWLSKAPEGALELCKSIEATHRAPAK
jgi:hypothetical protein